MVNAQETANRLHDAGLSDSDIAEMLALSREYINRIRNGKKTASEPVANALQNILNDLPAILQEREEQQEIGPVDTLEDEELTEEDELEETGQLTLGQIGIGVLILLAVIAAGFIWYKTASRVPTEEQHKQETNSLTNE